MFTIALIAGFSFSIKLICSTKTSTGLIFLALINRLNFAAEKHAAISLLLIMAMKKYDA